MSIPPAWGAVYVITARPVQQRRIPAAWPSIDPEALADGVEVQAELQ
jgi:hypothetical protein